MRDRPGVAIGEDEREIIDCVTVGIAPSRVQGRTARTKRLTAIDNKLFERRRSEPDGMAALIRAFGLVRADEVLLLACLAPRLEPRYARAFAYLRDDPKSCQATASLCATLFACDADLFEPHGGVRNLLTSCSRLRANGLVQALALGAGCDASHVALSVDDAILSVILGEPLRPCFPTSSGADSLPVLDQAMVQQLSDAIASQYQNEDRRVVVHVRGLDGVGRRAVVSEVCDRLGFRALRLSAEDLPDDVTALQGILRGALRDAKTLGWAVCIDAFDTLAARAGHEDALMSAISTVAAPPVFLVGKGEWRPENTEGLVLLSVAIGVPDAAVRRQLWAAYLGQHGEPDVIEEIASRFRLTPGQIRDAAVTVIENKDVHGAPIDVETLSVACRTQIRHRLGELGGRVERGARWEDLVLPEDQLGQLEELAAQVGVRDRVFDGWRLGERFGSQRGLTALFSGPSGTGRTMAAEALANHLCIDLFKVDLSRVVSKYIGETEKHLRAVFDEAECSNAILMFDEADALFGKRSEVKDSHDRYANLEVAYLLQRMEEYEGIAILSTNLIRETLAREDTNAQLHALHGQVQRRAKDLNPDYSRIATTPVVACARADAGYSRPLAARIPRWQAA